MSLRKKLENYISSLKKVIVITGNSGAGKSTLARSLCERINIPMLCFSYAGRQLSVACTSEKAKIENYFLCCIINELRHADIIIVDGIVSIDLVNGIKELGIRVCIITVDTPRKTRIQRIAERGGGTIEEATRIESDKSNAKDKSGLQRIIEIANYSLDGMQSKDILVESALKIISIVRENEKY